MNKIRARFRRGQELKYLGHLDLMRLFERAIRRARIPIEHTSGFNQHPKIVFGLPLGVGVVSEADYVEIKLTEDIEIIDFIRKFNDKVPAGLEIISAERTDDKNNVMAMVNSALYNVECFVELQTGDAVDKVPDFSGLICWGVDKMLDSNEIFVDKKGKKGLKKIDIRGMIKGIKIINSKKVNRGLKFDLEMLVLAGSKANLKPDLVVNSLANIINSKINIINIIRTGLYI